MRRCTEASNSRASGRGTEHQGDTHHPWLWNGNRIYISLPFMHHRDLCVDLWLLTWHEVRTQSSVNRALISSFCYILKISFFFLFFLFTLKTEVETFKIGVFVILLWNYPHVLCPLHLVCPVSSVKRYGQSLLISWISLNTILPKYLFSLLMKLNLLANMSFMPPIPTHLFLRLCRLVSL